MKTFLLSCACLLPFLLFPQTGRSHASDSIRSLVSQDSLRWLEDELNPRTQQWLKAQKDTIRAYDKATPWKYYVDYENYAHFWASPVRSGNRFLQFGYFKGSGILPYTAGVSISQRLSDIPSLLFKNTELSGGRFIVINNVGISYDRQNAAVIYRAADSLFFEISVVRLDGKILKDHVTHVWDQSVAWVGDGFYYTHYEATDDQKAGQRCLDPYQKIRYHRLGTEQAADKEFFFRKSSPDDALSTTTSYNEKYLFVQDFKKSTEAYSVFYKRLDGSQAALRPAIINTQNSVEPIEIYDDFLYSIVRPGGQGNGRIEAYNIATPDSPWRIVVPALSDSRIMDAHLLQDRIVVKYLQGNKYVIALYSYQGKFIKGLDMPGGFYCSDINTSHFDTIVYMRSWSETVPPVLYAYDVNSFKVTPVFSATVNYDINKYKTEHIFCRSADGSEIPLTIIYDQRNKPKGDNALMLAVGSGLGTLPPISYDPLMLTFMDKGGIYACANIRGGIRSEAEWYRRYRDTGKIKEIEDLTAVIKFLKDKKYTDDKHLLLMGENDGALITANVINQMPEAIKAAVLVDAPFDLMHHEEMTRSKLMQKEYGSVTDSAAYIRMYQLSPYHHIRTDVSYPALYIMANTVGIFPATHAMKYVAAIRSGKSNNICLLNFRHENMNQFSWFYAYPDRYENYWRFIFYQLGIHN